MFRHLIQKPVLLCVLFVFSIVLSTSGAAVAEEIAPDSVPGATTIDSAKAKELFDKSVLFVDVRKDGDYDAGHIPGSVHLELKKVFSAESLGKEAKKDEEIVIYCNGEKCLRSSEACAQAASWGFTKLYYYRDGFPDWKAKGFPVE